MKSLLKFGLVMLVPVFITGYLAGCNLKKSAIVNLDVSAKPFEKLSEYNFFAGVMNELKPQARVVPYDLNTPLFTDYAHKARFVYVPEGKTATYDTNTVVQFPVGACLIKSFYYPDDFREKNGKRKIIETRLLVHRESGWDALTYIWNDEQSEATLENAGDIKNISWVHYDGSTRKDEYIIPNKNQCKGCHWNNTTTITPIGPKVRNINRDLNYGDVTENQLTHWVKAGILAAAPDPATAPRLADWSDSVHYDVNTRARAYVEVNCAHCHNPKGPAYTSGLYLNLENKNSDNLGICKAPVAAGKGTGGRLFDIIPGSPDLSIIPFRVASTDAGIKMPELGRSLVHQEGVELLTKWIAQMEPNSCKPASK
jgi:uncharacterized repeat protein (TIGR03806 family)